MKQLGKTHIFLDLDGPILDVSTRHYLVYREFCLLTGIPPWKQDRYWRNKRARRPTYIPGKSIPEFHSFWLKHIERDDLLILDSLHAGVRDTLNFLSSRFDLFLITVRQNRPGVQATLARLKINHFFRQVLVQPPIPFTKDNWQVKVKLIAGLATSVDIVVGDSGADILCAQKLGLFSIGVLNGLLNLKILQSYQPDRLIKDINSLTHSWFANKFPVP